MNRIFAIPAAPDAIPVKPKNPATTAITAKIRAHFSISFSWCGTGSRRLPNPPSLSMHEL